MSQIAIVMLIDNFRGKGGQEFVFLVYTVQYNQVLYRLAVLFGGQLFFLRVVICELGERNSINTIISPSKGYFVGNGTGLTGPQPVSGLAARNNASLPLYEREAEE